MKIGNQNLNYSIIFILFVLLFQACAPSEVTMKEYGFFHGLWHGLIAVFAIIGKFFGMDIGLYAQFHSGLTYWIGYGIGIFLIICISASGGCTSVAIVSCILLSGFLL